VEHGVARSLEFARAHGRLLAYVIPTLAAFAAVQTWLRPGTFLAGGDLAPPLAQGPGYRSHWNQFSSGAGAPGYDIANLPFAEPLRLAHRLGISEVVFQQFWLTLVVAAVAATAVYLAFSFVDSSLAAGTAGILATFNAYRLTTSFDTVPLIASIAAAVLAGLIVRAARARSASPAAFVLVSPLLALAFVNPPHVALVIVWLAFCALLSVFIYGRVAAARIARFLSRALPLALAVNMWWVVPVFLTLTGPTYSKLFAAPGVATWQFTHKRSSIENVLALRSQWGWDYSEFFPYHTTLDHFPFTILAYFFPLLAAAGLFVCWRRARRLGVGLAVFSVAVIWVAKGIHPPLQGTNWWLYHHAPGFFLLREPAKVEFLLVLAFAILGGIAVAGLVRLLPRVAALCVVFVLVGGATVYSYPLLTGAVVPDDRPVLPSEHVRLPAAWREAADYLNSQPPEGKVLVLPRPDFYALPTTWGYYGASFSRYLINRPVIEPIRQSYFRIPNSVFALDAFVERNLGDPGGRGVVPQLQALGARYVLVRSDLAQGLFDRYFTDADRLERGLARDKRFHRVASFGILDVYRLDDGRPAEVFAASPRAYRGDSEGLPYALHQAPGTALVAMRDAQRLQLVRRPVQHVRLGVSREQERIIDPTEANAFHDCSEHPTAPARAGLAKRITSRAGVKVLQLEARRGIACLNFSVQPLDATALRLSFSYRTLLGRRARACVWLVGPNQCSSLPRLDRTRRWRRLDVTVPRKPRTEGVLLYLYADGGGVSRTVTEYKEIRLIPVIPMTLAAPVRSSIPEVHYRRVNPSEFRVRVENATGPHLLVATEAWAPGWRFAADRKSDDVRHVEADGYANAWLVPWRGSYEARLYYAPERYASMAAWTLLLYPVVLFMAVARPLRTRFRGGRGSSTS
jgi:Alpha-(1->3)-arabinofuranosyltransferase